MNAHADQIAWDAIQGKWARQRRAEAAACAFERYQLLRTLQSVGITAIEARYDGYGDEGNIEDVFITPNEIEPTDQFVERLKDLFWSQITRFHGNFENNDGGYGEFLWDVTEDYLSLEHASRITSREHYSYEDI